MKSESRPDPNFHQTLTNSNFDQIFRQIPTLARLWILILFWICTDLGTGFDPTLRFIELQFDQIFATFFAESWVGLDSRFGTRFLLEPNFDQIWTWLLPNFYQIRIRNRVYPDVAKFEQFLRRLQSWRLDFVQILTNF